MKKDKLDRIQKKITFAINREYRNSAIDCYVLKTLLFVF